jgi:hypothetical protein
MSTLCHFAAAILACYHPTAIPQQCQLTGYDTADIFYQGGLTRRPYVMTVQGQTDGNMQRIVLLNDNAVIPPNMGCAMGQWHPRD